MALIKRTAWGWSAFTPHGELIASADELDNLGPLMESLGISCAVVVITD